MNANILLKDYCPAIAERGGIASADIIDLNLDAIDIKDGAITKDKIADGAITADKFAETLKSLAIADLTGGATLSDVITAVNSILAALRTFGIIAPSE